MTSSYRFVVSGRVQGVFYRQSALQQARLLGLCGWVRNRNDGCVEGLAQGQALALEQFKAWLGQGPPAASVKAVEWKVVAEPEQSEFAIRR